MAKIVENIVTEETAHDDLEIILPDKWQTKLVDTTVKEGDVKVHILVNISTKEDFQNWLKEYENITGTSYVIRNTDIVNGKRLALKQRLSCHHFTKCKNTYSPLVKNKTRNTNCPSKLNVKIHSFRKNYRGKREDYDLFKNMPCEITLTANHNHETGTVDSLRFRKVSDSVRERLLGLYANGYNPTTALKQIQSDIQMNNDDYITALADRNQCPTYKYCYDLFMKVSKTKYRSGDFKLNAKACNALKNKLQSFNEKVADTCAKIHFIGQDSSDYVIGICTPIMKRVHKHIKNASKIVFMDSTGTSDRDGSRIYVLLTDSECVALPLGLIITTSESIEAIKCGFKILIELVGETIFGGHKEGPKVFILDDSSAEAVGDVWPGAKRFLCSFHVLQAVSRWLSESKNCIQKEHQTQIYNEFRKILYSVDENEMTRNYDEAVENGQKYYDYINYLKNHWWPKRESWVKAYRNNGLINNNDTNNYAENMAIRQIKLKIFSRLKAFNLVQITDLLLTKFEQYNEKKLLDASNNKRSQNYSFLDKQIKLLPAEIMERIIKLDDHFVEVPSETKNGLMHLVNMEILRCSCMDGDTGSICKHIDWANMLYCSDSYPSRIIDLKIRQKLYLIATGQAPKKGSLLPLNSKTESASSELNEFFTVSVEQPSCSSKDLVHVNSEKKTFSNFTEIHNETKRKYKETMNKMNEIFDKHFEKSPLEVLESVEKMYHTMKKIKTAADFNSANNTYGLGLS